MIFENEIANFRGMIVVLRTEGNLDDEDSKHRFETVSKRLEKILHQVSLHTDYEDLLDASNKLDKICDLCNEYMVHDAEKEQTLNSEMEWEPDF